VWGCGIALKEFHDRADRASANHDSDLKARLSDGVIQNDDGSLTDVFLVDKVERVKMTDGTYEFRVCDEH